MPNTPTIFSGITQLSEQFDALLLDAYGVFWGGNALGVLPGSQEAMERLVSKGKRVGILSNSTQLASIEIKKLHAQGLMQGTHFHFLVTSGEVSRNFFLNEKLPFDTYTHKFWLFGGPHPKFSTHTAIFQDTAYTETMDINEADFIYISVPHIRGEDQIDPELFREEIKKLKTRMLPMVCVNPDQFAHEGDPIRAVVRQGSIAMMYEEMGGQLFYIGKPHQMAYDAALTHFNQQGISDLKRILMVGDTPETDIRGARRLGMPSALLTQTGMMADRISRYGFEKALKALSSSDLPDYFIERLINDL
jgi:HAD superfamily hydrolase (TIGR01459 family)